MTPQNPEPKGEGVIYIRGLLDLNDPRQKAALEVALKELRGDRKTTATLSGPRIHFVVEPTITQFEDTWERAMKEIQSGVRRAVRLIGNGLRR